MGRTAGGGAGRAVGTGRVVRDPQPLLAARCSLLASRCSLLARDPDAHTLTLHRVVQAVLQDELDEDGQRRWAERAVRVVERGFPNPQEFSDWPQCERLLPQAQAAAAWIARWDFAFEERGRLLNQAAYYLYQRGRYAEAELLQQRALALRERALSPNHPAIAQSLNNLTELYRNQGHWVEAEPLFQRALEILERALSPNHPAITNNSLNNLALLYHAQGRTADAEPLFQHALAIRERALDPDHPDVANSLNNLVGLYRDQGRTAEAEPLFQRALAIWKRTEHPNLAAGLENYAVLLARTGCTAEAATLSAAHAAHAVRAHWSIENRLHDVRDVTLGEDASRIRRNPGLFALLRSFTLNLLPFNGVTHISLGLYDNALNFDQLLAYQGL